MYVSSAEKTKKVRAEVEGIKYSSWRDVKLRQGTVSETCALKRGMIGCQELHFDDRRPGNAQLRQGSLLAYTSISPHLSLLPDQLDQVAQHGGTRQAEYVPTKDTTQLRRRLTPLAALAMDPALVRYASMHHEDASPDETGLTKTTDMYVKRHEYFRWNRKTAGLTFLYMAFIPGCLYALAKSTEVSLCPGRL